MIGKFDYVKKKFAWQKHHNKVKRQLTNWEKLFVTYITKGCVSSMSKTLNTEE